jgi:hypothetical protein
VQTIWGVLDCTGQKFGESTWNWTPKALLNHNCSNTWHWQDLPQHAKNIQKPESQNFGPFSGPRNALPHAFVNKVHCRWRCNIDVFVRSRVCWMQAAFFDTAFVWQVTQVWMPRSIYVMITGRFSEIDISLSRYLRLVESYLASPWEVQSTVISSNAS